VVDEVLPTAGKRDAGASVLPRKYLLLFALVVLLFSSLAYFGFRWMQGNSLAVLVEYSGDAHRDTAAQVEKWFVATKGDEFENGDGARTRDGATAQFALANGARLILKPTSQIRFQHKPGEKGALGLAVEVGEADVRTDQGTLNLDSAFGEMLIDAGSLVTLRRQGDQMALMVELGSLQLSESQRSVDAGEEIVLELGGIVVDEKKEETPESSPGAAAKADEEKEKELDRGDGLTRADITARAGSSFTVHDPNPPTAIGINMSSVCKGPGRLNFGSKKTDSESQGNLPLGAGVHKYEVRCLDDLEKVAASGTIVVVRDSGSKQLPSFTPQASVATDGRRYTVLYQDRLPQVTVTWPSAPQATQYTLTIDGRAITTSGPSYSFASLNKGAHSLVFSANSTPARSSRATTVAVSYDSQAPKGRVEEPRGSFSPGGAVRVAGQALPGWNVSVGGRSLEMDGQHRFSAEIQPNGSLPIAFSHPTHGMHYYLRRPQGALAP
jgi:hypothetical protein